MSATVEGFTVEVLPEIDSSNSELMRRFRATSSAGSSGSQANPRAESILLVAEQQTAGRGRLGRQWLSRRGDSLTFSLGLPLRPTDWSGLSLVVGISLAESLAPAGGMRRISLKWPNDIWLGGPEGESKLAGILVETASWEGLRYAVIGVGINIRPATWEPQQVATGGLAPIPPGFLQNVFPELDAAATLLKVVPPLVEAVQAFERFGFIPFQARFARHDALAGRAVQLSDGSLGTAHGVGEDGALLVHTAAGMKQITSSEVSVRPLVGLASAGIDAKRGPC